MDDKTPDLKDFKYLGTIPILPPQEITFDFIIEIEITNLQNGQVMSDEIHASHTLAKNVCNIVLPTMASDIMQKLQEKLLKDESE